MRARTRVRRHEAPPPSIGATHSDTFHALFGQIRQVAERSCGEERLRIVHHVLQLANDLTCGQVGQGRWGSPQPGFAAIGPPDGRRGLS